MEVQLPVPGSLRAAPAVASGAVQTGSRAWRPQAPCLSGGQWAPEDTALTPCGRASSSAPSRGASDLYLKRWVSTWREPAGSTGDLLLCPRYNGHTRDAYFSVGLQGVAEADVPRVRDIVDRTLDDVIACVGPCA